MTEPGLINIYGDESCHLEGGDADLMVLGAVSVPQASLDGVNGRIRALKEAFGLPRNFEVKWTKVSPARVDFYLALIDLFFAVDDLSFRSWIAHGKSRLRHDDFAQDHSTWYHKMYYELLAPLLTARDRQFEIYIDIKDTRGGQKVRTLQEILGTKLRNPEKVRRIQIVRSEDADLLQLADLLIGAVCYRNRGLKQSTAKIAVVTRVEAGANTRLTYSTSLGAAKVNLFHWHPQAKE